jgi:hypothetical protein
LSLFSYEWRGYSISSSWFRRKGNEIALTRRTVKNKLQKYNLQKNIPLYQHLVMLLRVYVITDKTVDEIVETSQDRAFNLSRLDG